MRYNVQLTVSTTSATAVTVKWVGLINVPIDGFLKNVSFSDATNNFSLTIELNLFEGLNNVTLYFENSFGKLTAVIPGTYTLTFEYFVNNNFLSAATIPVSWE